MPKASPSPDPRKAKLAAALKRNMARRKQAGTASKNAPETPANAKAGA